MRVAIYFAMLVSVSHASSTAAQSSTGKTVGSPPIARRIAAVDMLRGLAVVFMTLDHARFYFDNGSALPNSIADDRPTLFFTHWLLQFCTPVFVLLAGTGAYLRLFSGRPKTEVAKFLATRGLLLVAIDLFIMPLVKWFNFSLLHCSAGPLWAIGWSMVAMAGLIFLRVGTVAIIGLAIVVLHNALDTVQAESLGVFSGLWIALYEPGVIRIGNWLSLEIVWPVLPWLGVMGCGFGIGEFYRISPDMRRTFLAASGLNLLMTFVILRAFNLYGDPAPWSKQGDFIHGVMSFVNCTRQPPSLCFLLMTISPALLLLSWFEGRRSWRLQALTTLGCVPLYCYVAHWLLLHAMAVGLALLRGQPTGWLFQTPADALQRGANWQPQFGVELTLAMLLGAAALPVLYFSARRYAQIKFLRRPRWASYF